MIYVYAKDAIRDYSMWFPLRVDRHEIAVSSGAYSLPSNYIEDIHVEGPIGTVLERYNFRPGVKLPAKFKSVYYYIQGGSIYLNSPLDSIYLTYHAAHPVPTSETNAAYVFTVPDTDIELIRLYVKARIYGQMKSRQSALDRFKQGNGSRDDNPLAPEFADLMTEYQQKISERIVGGAITLYRPGRSS